MTHRQRPRPPSGLRVSGEQEEGGVRRRGKRRKTPNTGEYERNVSVCVYIYPCVTTLILYIYRKKLKKEKKPKKHKRERKMEREERDKQRWHSSGDKGQSHSTHHHQGVESERNSRRRRRHDSSSGSD